KPLQARINGPADEVGDVRQGVRGDADLGGEVDRGPQPFQHTTEVGLRPALTVPGSGVEPVDPRIKRAGNGGMLSILVHTGHQPAYRPRAKSHHRYPDPGPAQFAVIHCCPGGSSYARITTQLSASPSPRATRSARTRSWSRLNGTSARVRSALATMSRTSFRCCASLASGAKSASIIF